jgi:colicin import membrane protein
MLAGTLQIQIEAEYAKLEDQLRDVASKSEDAGKKAAEKFGAKFKDAIKGFGKQAAEGLSEELGKIGKPKQMIAVVAAALKEAAAGGGWQDTLLAGLKSIPIVSAMSDIIENTIKLVTGAAKQEMKAAADSAKADKAYAAAKARTDDINARQVQHEDALLQAKIDNAVAVGDAYAEAYAVADLEYQKIARKRDEDLKKSTDDENGKQRKLIEQTYQDELAAITRNYDMKVSKADEAAAKEAEAQRKAAEDAATAVYEKQQKDAEELAKLNQKLAADEEKRQRKIADDVAKATKESDQARSAAVAESGSISTSFGTYTYSAYTDAEKKSNDEKMVAGLKDVVKAIETQSATGGFE